jgi:hypothetical protein
MSTLVQNYKNTQGRGKTVSLYSKIAPHPNNTHTPLHTLTHTPSVRVENVIEKPTWHCISLMLPTLG